MSILGSFETGKKAMTAAQLGQSTTGHNIANVDTDGFSRQEINQSSVRPVVAGVGQGVDVLGIRRHTDGFTKEKVVAEQTHVGKWNMRENFLIELESVYTDLEGGKLRGALDEFWSAWGTLSHQPESTVMRKSMIHKASVLSERFNVFHDRLVGMQDTLNDRIKANITEINSLTKRIADANKQVTQIENRGRQANDARDSREALLQELSKHISIRYSENERGNMEVQLPNGQSLVHDRQSYELVADTRAEANGDVFIGLKSHTGRLTDVSGVINNGSLKEMITLRDDTVKKYLYKLNELSSEIVLKVNAIHSGGTGLHDMKSEEVSHHAFGGAAATQPLPLVESGFFQIKLVDDEGDEEDSFMINIEAGVDSVTSIVEKINKAVDAYEYDEEGNRSINKDNDFYATLGGDGRVTLRANNGNRFIFDGDNTNTLALLGFNTFFEGMGNAGAMSVRDNILQDELKVAAGYGLIPSDNTIALAVGDLQTKLTMNEGTMSFDEYYNSQVTEIGLNVQEAKKGSRAHLEMLGQYEALRDSVSSVNLDEEMANMAKYQRAYESSAKYLSTIDQMTETLINM